MFPVSWSPVCTLMSHPTVLAAAPYTESRRQHPTQRDACGTLPRVAPAAPYPEGRLQHPTPGAAGSTLPRDNECSWSLMSVLVEFFYLYPRGLRDSGTCLVRVRSGSLMGPPYDAGGDAIPGCLFPRGGSGFLATLLAEAPYPDGLRVPDLRCRASWSPSASPLMVSICLSSHGVRLPLPSWSPSASPLMESVCLSPHGVRLHHPSWSTSASTLMVFVCLSHHGVHLPLPSWTEWLRELSGTSVRLACDSTLDVLLPSPFSTWGASTASVWGLWMACWVPSCLGSLLEVVGYRSSDRSSASTSLDCHGFRRRRSRP